MIRPSARPGVRRHPPGRQGLTTARTLSASARQAGHRGLSAGTPPPRRRPAGRAFPADEVHAVIRRCTTIRRRPAPTRVAITLRIRHERAGGCVPRAARSPSSAGARGGAVGTLRQWLCGTAALARQIRQFSAVPRHRSRRDARGAGRGRRGTTAASGGLPPAPALTQRIQASAPNNEHSSSN